ncbi:MAG: hypothetical protein ABIJ96_00390 [Elusimicrobiota bacterium]
MKTHLIAGFILLAGFGSAAAQLEPSAPEVEQLAYFPSMLGTKNLYITFYASRKHEQRQVSEKTYWDEVVETVIIHGFRVVVVRSSTGTLSQKDGAWVYGQAEAAVNESVYVITSAGVVLYSVYAVSDGTEAGYAQRRNELIKTLADTSRAEFIEELQNWILPFPVKAGLVRKWNVDANSYYKVLRSGDKRFVNKLHRKKAFGVAGFIGGEWGMTRWFVPGKGLVLFEAYNRDDGVDTDKFPFKVKALAVYAGD